MALSETQSLSIQEQKARAAVERFQAYHTRPSTVAAQEFLGIVEGRRKTPLHWESLLERVEKLARTLQEWVSNVVSYLTVSPSSSCTLHSTGPSRTSQNSILV